MAVACALDTGHLVSSRPTSERGAGSQAATGRPAWLGAYTFTGACSRAFCASPGGVLRHSWASRRRRRTVKSSNHPFQPSRAACVAAILTAALLGLGCDEKKKGGDASQAAAKVNSEDITVQQINQVLQQQRGLRPEQAEAASKQILERLIDQELAAQKAIELKLDREPRVLQQIEAAKREIVSRAYLDKAGEAASTPTPEEIAKYYDEQPALFKGRRVYNLQEISIEAKAEQIPLLKEKLEASRNVAEFVESLKAAGFAFSANQAVRAAEQLPLRSLANFGAMKDGQAMLNASPTGAQVIVLAGSSLQPVTLEQARPAIEQFLLNERRREILAKDLKALRDAGKIEYIGKFAASAPAAVGVPAAAASAPASGASGGPDASSGLKGMGPK
ncbi:MAG TPA: EpsD family peptidyl-prolyl cis-trans isomerase [Rubrivivax sp.]|nr:EpsD family peptidyl-prolyl cis-trans isomerase [Rubrivivax sp.]